jgi:hypothetical protein
VVESTLEVHKEAWRLVAIEMNLPMPLGSALNRIKGMRDDMVRRLRGGGLGGGVGAWGLGAGVCGGRRSSEGAAGLRRRALAQARGRAARRAPAPPAAVRSLARPSHPTPHPQNRSSCSC